MRIVLAKGSSQYGSLRLHIDQLAAALIELGHDAVVVDVAADAAASVLAATLSVPTQGLVTFNGMLHDLAAADFVRRVGCVYVSLYVDHPIHHLDRLNDKIVKQALFFLDQTHVEFMCAWGGGRNFGQIALLAPGANELTRTVDVSDEAFSRRDIPILFTGTYRGAPRQPWRDWPHSPARQLVAETAERMADDGAQPLLAALEATLSAHNASMSETVLTAIAPVLNVAQQYAEAYHRHAVLAALGAAGVQVQVHGLGWEALSAIHPSYEYRGVGSFEETLHLLRRARIVLNINNGFIAGGHERVFSAMCAGACIFTDASRYYANAFKEGDEVAVYSVNQLDRVPDQLIALAGDPNTLSAIARAGHGRAVVEHRWATRAPAVVAAISAGL